MDSTMPSRDFGVPTARPDAAARAAAYASSGSDFPWVRRAARSGRSTSTTTTPAAVSTLVSPAPYETGALDANSEELFEGCQPCPHRLVAAGCRRELPVAHLTADRIDHRRVVGQCMSVYAAEDFPDRVLVSHRVLVPPFSANYRTARAGRARRTRQ